MKNPKAVSLDASALQPLLTAKRLMRLAEELCIVPERHTASAGVIVLQDAVELVLLACLILKSEGDDALTNDNFAGLLKGLRAKGVRLYREEQLRQLNNLRNGIKHHGRVAEPSDAALHLQQARTAIDTILERVVGKRLAEVYLHELLDGRAKEILRLAQARIRAGEPYAALILARVVLFEQFEFEYCVDEFEDVPDEILSLGSLLGIERGWKAPAFSRRKSWITENVSDPTGYVQIEDATLRLDLLMMGISVSEFQSVRVLTPRVYIPKDFGRVDVRHDTSHLDTASTEANAAWCLERVAGFVLAKQEFQRARRDLPVADKAVALSARAKSSAIVFRRAASDSPVVGKLVAGREYRTIAAVKGLRGAGPFVLIAHLEDSPQDSIYGYVESRECEFLGRFRPMDEDMGVPAPARAEGDLTNPREEGGATPR